MIEADEITIHTKDRNFTGKFSKEYKYGIIVKSIDYPTVIMIPWHYIEFVEYDIVDRDMKQAINELISGD